MFKALVLHAQHNLSDAKMEFMIWDRLSWMRFLRFDLGGADAGREHDPGLP
jgi:IS5 family transposase